MEDKIGVHLLWLKNANDVVRQNSISAFVKIGAEAVPALIEALKGDEYLVRESATAALGQIGDARAVLALTEALKDSHVGVRGNAAKALGEIRDVRAIPALIEAVKADRYYGTGANALEKIRVASAPPPPDTAVQQPAQMNEEHAPDTLVRPVDTPPNEAPQEPTKPGLFVRLFRRNRAGK